MGSNDLDEEPASEVVVTIKEFAGEAVACVGKVTDADFGDRFFETAIKTFNGLDISVSNAGYALDGVVQKMGDDQFQKMLDVHVVAPFRIMRAAAEPIRLFSQQDAAAGEETFRQVVLIS